MDDSSGKEIAVEFAGVLRLYKDGSVERLIGWPRVPPSPEDPETGASSKDVTISKHTGLSARLYLPKLTNPSQKKLPILVYYHGGAFCAESASSLTHHRYTNLLSSLAQVIVVSVEYRLAPEHPVPAAYEDSWEALKWVASNSPANGPDDKEPWLVNHGDFDAIFLGGGSAGGNISHNMAIRAGDEPLPHGVKILGAFMSHPYFLGSKRYEPKLDMAFKLWEFVYPDVPGGVDNPMMNPIADGAPSLAKLGCSRVLVLVAANDEFRQVGVAYFNAVKESGYEGKVELFEVEGVGHVFHILNPDTENAKLMLKRLASFLQK